MKFEAPIEVSGITRVVINRNMIWGYMPVQKAWALQDGTPAIGKTHLKTEHQMQRWISSMLGKLKKSKVHKGCFTWANRAWVHGDTLNIVRRT